MCLILFAYQKHKSYKLILGGNRDEFYNRPTEKAGYWPDSPNILGGRDLQAKGTWMGINKTTGNICMLTNYRDPANIKTDAPSRGHLVSNFLKKDYKPEPYINSIKADAQSYNGFNMVLGSADHLWYYSNQFSDAKILPKGVYGLSNHLLNTSWPKVTKGKLKLNAIIEDNTIHPESILEALFDEESALEKELPDTGVGLEMEKMLSPMFIKSPVYGSRCSTVILVDYKDNVTFVERTYNTENFSFQDEEFRFKIG